MHADMHIHTYTHARIHTHTCAYIHTYTQHAQSVVDILFLPLDQLYYFPLNNLLICIFMLYAFLHNITLPVTF